MTYEPDNDVSSINHQLNANTFTFDYTYNKTGSRVSFASTDDRILYQPLASHTKEYATNNLNQYTSINATSLTHDLNGNLTSTGANAYTYDPENRLQQAITPSVTSSYTSDPMGRRQSKIINTITTDYLYDGDNVIMEFDGSDTMTRRFIYGPGIDDPVCMVTPTDRYFYHADALGSIVALSNEAGNLEETYAYSPFGIINNAGTIGNPYLFTGRRLDSESGLYYYRARHYDADLGRFIQPDPIGFEGGINLYAYVSNNPVNLYDPFGLAYRQKRPLDSWGLRGTTIGSLHHDRFEFKDGTESGYYSDSTVRDDNAPQELIGKYKNVGEYLHDDILKDVVDKIKPQWDKTKGSNIKSYKLTDFLGKSRNCQDYADAVMAEYNRLKKERESAKQTESNGK